VEGGLSPNLCCESRARALCRHGINFVLRREKAESRAGPTPHPQGLFGPRGRCWGVRGTQSNCGGRPPPPKAESAWDPTTHRTTFSLLSAPLNSGWRARTQEIPRRGANFKSATPEDPFSGCIRPIRQPYGNLGLRPLQASFLGRQGKFRHGGGEGLRGVRPLGSEGAKATLAGDLPWAASRRSRFPYGRGEAFSRGLSDSGWESGGLGRLRAGFSLG